MFFPDHELREYCLYLGSVELPDGRKFDLGVYEQKPQEITSHAIVFGPKPHEYISGEVHSMSEGTITKLNKAVYLQYLVQSANRDPAYRRKWVEGATKYMKEPKDETGGG